MGSVVDCSGRVIEAAVADCRCSEFGTMDVLTVGWLRFEAEEAVARVQLLDMAVLDAAMSQRYGQSQRCKEVFEFK